jgi:hypothetical protein
VELEDKTDHAHETIHEHVAEGHHRPSTPRWFTHVALSTLLMALLSASGALMAAISAHESLLERSQEILDFVALETDRVEIEVLQSKHEILRHLDETPAESEVARVKAYREDVSRLTKAVSDEESLVRATTHAHLVFAVAVTLLSIGITLGGMAIIARQRFLWLIGLIFGLAGTVSVALGFRDMM